MRSIRKNIYLPLWIGLFCYTTIAALLFQKLLLPHLPALHAGYGLMNHDAIYFHKVALSISVYIEQHGWSWQVLWPGDSGAKGNVAILGFLYTLFGPDPSLILPINAFFHATSGVLLLLIVRIILPGKLGVIAGVLSAILFVLFPSGINWYGQIHKDGYSIAGTLIIIYSWVRYIENPDCIKSKYILYGGSLTGLGLIIFVMPYMTLFLSAALSIWVLVSTVAACTVKPTRKVLGHHINILLAWILIAACSVYFGDPELPSPNINLSPVAPKYSEATLLQHNLTENSDDFKKHIEKCTDWEWIGSVSIPELIERYIEIASKTRASLICHNYGAASNIDQDVLPDNIIDVIKHLPRALSIALFAPFPDSWMELSSIQRIVGIAETIIWYLILPGVFLSLITLRTRSMIFVVMIAILCLCMYGYVIANVGTLHRVRYVCLLALIGVGLVGWVAFIARYGKLHSIFGDRFSRKEEEISISNALDVDNTNNHRRHAAKGGMLVAVIAMLSFVGFFIRDVLIARTFGMSNEMDAFYIAMLVPMFIVNVFGQSFGSTSVALYMRENNKDRNRGLQIVQNLSFLVTISLFSISTVLVLMAPVYLPVVGWSFSVEKIALTENLLYSAMPILLFSGMVILGNSILSARMHFAVPGWSQAVVPVFAISSFLFVDDDHGIEVVVWGMVIGQIVNLLLIQIFLRKDSLTLMPSPAMNNMKLPAEAGKQFLVLTLVTVFVQISLLIDNSMASSLDVGSVSMLGMGYKVIYFITGIITTIMSLVVLPYFLKIIVANNIVAARNELSLLLTIAVALGMLVSIVMYYVSVPLTEFLIIGGKINTSDSEGILAVIRMGVLQIPFFSVQLVLIKYATAINDNKSILVSSMIGVVMNIALNYILMGIMGVSGIALSTSLSVLVTSSILLLLIHKEGGVGWIDIMFLLKRQCYSLP